MPFSDSENELNDTPGTSSVRPQAKISNRNFLWRQRDAADIIPQEPAFSGHICVAKEPRNPIDYFRVFFDKEMSDNFVNQSNLYSAQTNINQPLNLDTNELEQFIGVLFTMSIVRMPKARC